MPTIAAVLIVKNEAAMLPQCLAHLGWVDELVVVDDESTDETVAIAEQHGAKVFSRKLDRFDTQRNYAMDQATCDWILSIDADEVVPDALADEIREVLERPDAADVYGIPFQHKISGRWVSHGGWGAPLTRLFKQHVRWTGAVHEQIGREWSYGVLRHSVLHYSHRNIGEFLSKLGRYTDDEAQARVAEGNVPTRTKLLLSPLRDFYRRYLVEKGYRDGTLGLILAVLMAFYVFVARAKAWELANPADESEPDSLIRP